MEGEPQGEVEDDTGDGRAEGASSLRISSTYGGAEWLEVPSCRHGQHATHQITRSTVTRVGPVRLRPSVAVHLVGVVRFRSLSSGSHVPEGPPDSNWRVFLREPSSDMWTTQTAASDTEVMDSQEEFPTRTGTSALVPAPSTTRSAVASARTPSPTSLSWPPSVRTT